MVSGMKLLLATLFLVFFKGIQQQVVIGGHYVVAALMPFLLAMGEVATVLWVVDTGWAAIPWVGTGGAIGVTLSMYVFRRATKKAKLKPVRFNASVRVGR